MIATAFASEKLFEKKRKVVQIVSLIGNVEKQ